MARPYSIAASAAVELPLVGPTRRATVVATTPVATYVTVDDPEHAILCLATADAVRVPCALVLQAKTLPPPPPEGTIGTVGGGVMTLAGRSFRVARWWRPPRPRGLGAAPPSRLAGAVRWLNGRVADPLDSAGQAAVADLVQALAIGASPAPAVARLLGRGPGLTPTGDDVLAGALVCLNALGSPAATVLGQAVLAAAPSATTTVSAALLRHAARGECVPQLADLLDAVGGRHGGVGHHGGADPAAGALPRAAGALLAVGNCSGAGLLHGVIVALGIAHRRLAQSLVPVPAAA